MSDLTPEEQARHVRARELTRPDGIRRTLDRLDQAAEDRGLYDLAQLCDDAALTVRYLRQQLELRDRLAEQGLKLTEHVVYDPRGVVPFPIVLEDTDDE